MENLAGALGDSGMILMEEAQGALDDPAVKKALDAAGLVAAARQVAANCEYLLLRRRIQLPSQRVVLEVDEGNSYAWVDTLRDTMKRAENEDMRVYVWSRAPCAGVMGLATCLRGEAGGRALRVYHLPGVKEKFDPEAKAFAAQVKLDLAFNVLRSGVWGCYRHLLLTDVADAQLQVRRKILKDRFYFFQLNHNIIIVPMVNLTSTISGEG